MSGLKKLLGSVTTLIEKHDYESAKAGCLEALEIDSNSAKAYILLGYCYMMLNSAEDSEKAYRKAIELNEKSPFGYQGLMNLFEKRKNVSKYLDVVEPLVMVFQELDDIDRCTAIVNKMRKFVIENGSRIEMIRLYKLLLPGGVIYSFLEGRIPQPSDTLEKLTQLIEEEERSYIVSSINKQKNRLGVNIAQITQKIKREVFSSSDLEKYYEELLSWSDDTDQRRRIEGRLLEFLYNKLLSLKTTEKSGIRQKIMDLVSGMVTIKSPIEQAWLIYWDWRDFRDLGEIDISLLNTYITMFPDSPLSRVFRAYILSDISPFNQKDVERALKDDDDEDSENTETFIAEKLSDTEVLEYFLEGYEYNPQSVITNRLLGKYYCHIGEYENAVDMAQAGLRLITQIKKDTDSFLKKSHNAINLTLATSYIYYHAPRHFKDALEIFDLVSKYDSNNTEALIGKSLILIESAKVEEAYDLLSKLLKNDEGNVTALTESSWCKILLGDYKSGRAGLSHCLSMIEKDDASSTSLRAKIWWRIGYSFWNESESYRSDRSAAYSAFMNSLKCNPNFSSAYTSLGIYYADILHDDVRASKCFHKAFELNATEAEAARRLAEIFANDQEWELVEMIASRFADAERKLNVPGNESSWQYKVLGISYLQSRNLPLSIQSFQSALRVNSRDSNSWTGLGEAYAASGRYLAAIKALQRATELDPESWYSKFYLGVVQRRLSEFDQAEQTLRSVLSIVPKEPIVLEYLAETLVATARHHLNINHYTQAVQDCIKALNTVDELVSINPKIFNIWKTAGDACEVFLIVKSEIQKFPIELAERCYTSNMHLLDTDVLGHLRNYEKEIIKSLEERYVSDVETTILDFYIATYKFSLVVTYEDLKARPVGWFNLARAYLRAYYIGARDLRYRDCAIECFKCSLKLEPKNPEFWNVYGVVMAEKSSSIAQHAFIRSLLIDSKDAKTWANLGVLYLINNDLELANLAFIRAQSSDPDNVNSWIGQGLSYMIMGNDIEAKNLFEHSYAITEKSNKLANLLFALTSFKSSNAKHLHSADLSAIVFALEKVLQLDPDNLAVGQYEALLLERLTDYEYAAIKLEKICAKLEQLYEAEESFEYMKSFVVSEAQLARIYLGQKNFNSALESAQVAIDLSEGDLSLKKSRLSGLLTAGLAHFYMDHYEEALRMFQLSIQESGSDPDIVVLLSKVLYSFGKETKERAQDELFQNIENYPQNVKSILLLGTIGIIEDNAEVMDAVESEFDQFGLSKRIEPVNANRQIELLLSGIEGRKEDFPSKRPWLQTAILQPSDYKVWVRLDHEIAIQTALASDKVVAEELSNILAASQSFQNRMRAIFISPGNRNAWKGVNDYLTVLN
ncbi:hypothetical protein V1511DRAFT_491157 [Dipodascopsis uninucleata]